MRKMFGSGLLAVHHADTEVFFFFKGGGMSESGCLVGFGAKYGGRVSV